MRTLWARASRHERSILRKEYRDIARKPDGDKPDLPIGVYAGLLGPNYETPAEIRYLRTIGADLQVCPTVPETIVANHMEQSPVFPVPRTWRCGRAGKEVVHDEVLEVGAKDTLVDLLRAIIPKLT